MEEVVQKVADNPPARTSTAPKASTAPAAAPGKADAPAQPKRGRGRPRKDGSAATPRSTKSVHPKEGTKRLTLDIPQGLHKRLKLLAIHQEISMKDYIIAVVERSLK